MTQITTRYSKAKIKKHNMLIDEMGGTNALARQLDLKKQTVSSWRRDGIPKAWLWTFFIEARKRGEGEEFLASIGET